MAIKTALKILHDHPGISAKAFALFYYDRPETEHLLYAVSNQGNGACAGKKAWLCAGSYLGKLIKKGYVKKDFDRYGSQHFFLTIKGERTITTKNIKETTPK